ncbi:ABC transporter ATP-binding protein [Desulfovibrio inopinatus]|uniref:ABC transporter ATP-binding protein n=1 Tax=Desulfovibrio inopinatus TaxID=102109 RepID=UPI0004033E82|nr:ABC transporter ATP-binding protein [Desulfovibrio inopinatus]
MLELKGITKRFGPVTANDRIDLEVARGEVLALLGENGAGKSTLMSILAGKYRPDAGSIAIDGNDVAFTSPADALAQGIGMVYQQFMLVENLTVLDNIILAGGETGFFPRRRQALAKVTSLATRLGFEISPHRKIFELSMGERQQVEILKLLYRDAAFLIFDEPTSILSEPEIEQFCDIVARLKQENRAVVFITHKLDEALRLADRISILRRGKLVARTTPEAVHGKRNLARLMVGREVIFQIDKPTVTPGDVVFSVSGASGLDHRGRTAFADIDLSVRRGEIVAIMGVAGNGQAELTQALAGLNRFSTGTIGFLGRHYDPSGWSAADKAGFGYVPEDRHDVGSVAEMNLLENIVLTGYRRRFDGPFMRLSAAMGDVKHAMVDFDVRAAGWQTLAGRLSGGNLQKLILAREILAKPEVLLVHQPTQGLDVGASEDVWKALLDARKTSGVLLVSQDMRETMTLADRIAIMFRGRILAVLNADDPQDIQRISPLLAGVTETATVQSA